MNKAYSTLTSDVESDLATEHYTIYNLFEKKIPKRGRKEKMKKKILIEMIVNKNMLKKILWQLKSMILKLQKMVTWMNELYESKCEGDNVNKCIIYISIFTVYLTNIHC